MKMLTLKLIKWNIIKIIIGQFLINIHNVKIIKLKWT